MTGTRSAYYEGQRDLVEAYIGAEFFKRESLNSIDAELGARLNNGKASRYWEEHCY